MESQQRGSSPTCDSFTQTQEVVSRALLMQASPIYTKSINKSALNSPIKHSLTDFHSSNLVTPNGCSNSINSASRINGTHSSLSRTKLPLHAESLDSNDRQSLKFELEADLEKYERALRKYKDRLEKLRCIQEVENNLNTFENDDIDSYQRNVSDMKLSKQESHIMEIQTDNVLDINEYSNMIYNNKELPGSINNSRSSNHQIEQERVTIMSQSPSSADRYSRFSMSGCVMQDAPKDEALLVTSDEQHVWKRFDSSPTFNRQRAATYSPTLSSPQNEVSKPTRAVKSLSPNIPSSPWEMLRNVEPDGPIINVSQSNIVSSNNFSNTRYNTYNTQSDTQTVAYTRYKHVNGFEKKLNGIVTDRETKFIENFGDTTGKERIAAVEYLRKEVLLNDFLKEAREQISFTNTSTQVKILEIYKSEFPVMIENWTAHLLPQSYSQNSCRSNLPERLYIDEVVNQVSNNRISNEKYNMQFGNSTSLTNLPLKDARDYTLNYNLNTKPFTSLDNSTISELNKDLSTRDRNSSRSKGINCDTPRNKNCYSERTLNSNRNSSRNTPRDLSQRDRDNDAISASRQESKKSSKKKKVDPTRSNTPNKKDKSRNSSPWKKNKKPTTENHHRFTVDPPKKKFGVFQLFTKDDQSKSRSPSERNNRGVSKNKSNSNQKNKKAKSPA